MAKGKTWAHNQSRARLLRLEEVTFFCTFELFSQGLPLPPTQETTNAESGLFQAGSRTEGYREKQKEEGLREWGALG